MKINLDEKSYLKVSLDRDREVVLSIKAKRNDDSHVIVSANLNFNDVDKLISSLVSFRTSMER